MSHFDKLMLSNDVKKSLKAMLAHLLLVVHADVSNLRCDFEKELRQHIAAEPGHLPLRLPSPLLQQKFSDLRPNHKIIKRRIGSLLLKRGKY
jgi:hypothetical protein